MCEPQAWLCHSEIRRKLLNPNGYVVLANDTRTEFAIAIPVLE